MDLNGGEDMREKKLCVPSPPYMASGNEMALRHSSAFIILVSNRGSMKDSPKYMS